MPENLDPTYYRRCIASAVLESAREHGFSRIIASDLTADLTYRMLFARAYILGRKLKPRTENQNFVGMLLPNSLAAVVTFFSLQLLGKIPCMLNFSSGESNILHACRIANVKTVLTSRQFIEKGKLEAIASVLEKNFTVIYLEDLRPTISLLDKICGMAKAFFPRVEGGSPDEPAVILYTSGSEGVPKGVALSHENILANIAQVRARVELHTSDTVFNALPVFHSFGLSVGMIMPLVCSLRTMLYPSPLQYREIPKWIAKSRATILLGADTFLRGWATYAKPEDFKTVRLAVAGAEKLKATTRTNWQEKFGVNIFEGYGVTEASPVVACNTPQAHKDGTVGRPFPQIECKLEPVAGLHAGGRLLIKGPNIMLGYLNANVPGTIIPQPEWYDTGDIVSIDDEGFIAIQGRAKRFAKIGGEMVSLAAVEELAAGLSPDHAHAAIAIADERKGEQILLLTEDAALTKEALVQEARAKGVAELFLPKQITFKETIPKLGSGKIDYPALTRSL